MSESNMARKVVLAGIGVYLIVDAILSIISYLGQPLYLFVLCFVRIGIGIYLLYYEVGINRGHAYYDETRAQMGEDDMKSISREELMNR